MSDEQRVPVEDQTIVHIRDVTNGYSLAFWCYVTGAAMFAVTAIHFAVFMAHEPMWLDESISFFIMFLGPSAALIPILTPWILAAASDDHKSAVPRVLAVGALAFIMPFVSLFVILMNLRL